MVYENRDCSRCFRTMQVQINTNEVEQEYICIACKGIVSPTELDFIVMDRQYALEIKPFLEQFSEVKKRLLEENGVDFYFQDDEGIVYKTVEPDGKFVYFEKAGVVRTKRIGEKRGTLSMKEALEEGFEIDK